MRFGLPHHAFPALLLACGLLLGCQGTAPQALTSKQLEAALSDRIGGDARELARRWTVAPAEGAAGARAATEALARVGGALPVPPSLLEADGAPSLVALAWAHGPKVHPQRERFLAAVASAEAAGQLETVGVSLAEGIEGDGRSLGGRVDLLTALGLGRAAGARHLAAARARAAFLRLEAVAFESVFAVWRQVIALRTLDQRLLALRALELEADEDLLRASLLASRGFLDPGPLAAGLGLRERLRVRRQAAEQRRAEVEGELRRLLGRAADALPPQTTPRASDIAIRAAALRSWRDARPEYEQGAALAWRHPTLRAQCLDDAVAMAAIEETLARQWPRIDVGLVALLRPDTLLDRWTLDSALPWPPRIAAEVAAARAVHRAVRHELLAAISGQEALVRSRDEALAVALATVEAAAAEVGRASAESFGAARARFRLEAAGFPRWVDAFERRIEGCVALPEALGAAELAQAAWLEAQGVLPEEVPF